LATDYTAVPGGDGGNTFCYLEWHASQILPPPCLMNLRDRSATQRRF
jgi:hypothetical protein